MNLKRIVRSLLRTPGETLFSVFAVCAGIALTTTLFSIVKGVIWNPPPVASVERLVTIDGPPEWHSAFREQSRTLEAVEAVTVTGANAVTARTPRRVLAGYVSPGLFTTLGTSPAFGVNLLEPRTAVLSHSFWTAAFNSDANLANLTLDVNGQTMNVIGVMPAGFRFRGSQDLWVAHDPASHNTVVARGRGSSSFLVGRIRPGATVSDAAAEANALVSQLVSHRPGEPPPVVAVRRLAEADVKSGIRTLTLAVLVCCFFVLLIACTNLANLTLARTARRLHELGVRSALGAPRWKLMMLLLSENVTIAGAGAAAGVLLASALLNLFTDVLRQESLLTGASLAGSQFTIDLVVLCFVLFLTGCTALASGIVPVWKATAGPLEEVLRSGARSLSPRSGWFTSALIQVQLAASVLLLVATGAMGSLMAQFGSGVTYDPSAILSARIDLAGAHAGVLDAIASALTSRRELAAAALTTAEHVERTNAARVVSERTREDVADAQWQGVTPGYFEVFGSRVLAGRGFGAQDDANGSAVAIVNRELAKRLWPDANAVGRRFGIRGQHERIEWLTVAGVAENIGSLKQTTRQVAPAFYRPLAQVTATEVSIVARHRADAKQGLQAVQRIVRIHAPDRPLFQVFTAAEISDLESIGTRVPALLLGLCGCFALVLSGIGAYGVLSLSVSQRTREIGIRLAIGATPFDVLRPTLLSGLRHVGAGIVIGLAGGWILTRLLASLFGSMTMQAGINIAVALLMGVVGLAAVGVPAWRASRLDPMLTLRE
ncbi:MAG TPA: ABC transporter permease [Bryobacteraceae bacterium]|nr:ABC transporter permease [Bryobacteraceae bacterium]